MYDTLSIAHFRAFKKLEVAPLHRVNLIAGGNNVGKTSLLEAIWFAAQENPFAAHAPSLFRRSATDDHVPLPPPSTDDTNNFWEWLFFKHDLTHPVSIKLTCIPEQAHPKLAYVFNPKMQQLSPRAETTFMDSDLRNYGVSADLYSLVCKGKVRMEDIAALFAAGKSPENLVTNPNVVAEIENLPSDERANDRSVTIRRDGKDIVAIAGDIEVHSRLGARSIPVGPFLSPLGCMVLPASLPSPVDDAEKVNMVSVLERDDALVDYMRAIDARINKLKYLKLPGHQHPYVYASVTGIEDRMIPATQLGQGAARMINLFAGLLTEYPGILLIDEFENGLQHDALVPIWSALGKFAREHDVQIFATTHSYECIASAHEAFSAHAEDFAVIKLRPDPALGIASFVLDYEAVEAALNTELEIR